MSDAMVTRSETGHSWEAVGVLSTDLTDLNGFST